MPGPTAILMSDGTMATDIKDIKESLYFPSEWKMFVLLAVLAVFLAAGILAYFLSRRRAGQKLIIAPAAHAIAYRALEDLRQSGLLKEGRVSEYFFRLSFIVRQYLENRFVLPAPEMTTEEFLLCMKESDKLSQDIKGLLRSFLERADMVKFARYGPTAEEIMGAFDSASRLVDQTKNEVC